MKTATLDEYRALMKAQGVPREHTAFRCPMCSTVQSAADLLAAGAGDNLAAVEPYLAFSCVGRFTGAALLLAAGELEKRVAALSAPPAAGVPEGWKLVPEEPTPAMLAAFVEANGKAVRGYKAMLAAAPTRPASEQQRAVGLDVIDKLRIELLPEYEAGYTAIAYGDCDQPIARATGMTAREAITELLRLNPHLAKGEGV